ncbi:MAG: signal peptidase II [Peptococcaceae bacterium]|nr:signal peptidase II [Peptococcaceae bacterium]
MYFFVPLIAGLILDQALKSWIRTNMTIGQSIPVIQNIFHITYIENPGAAFGILANQRILFLILTALITGIMVYLYLNLRNKKSVAALSLGLVISGAIGNFIDRFIQGTVTDMFDFRIWPVFNIADICICIGIALLCYILIFKGEEL